MMKERRYWRLQKRVGLGLALSTRLGHVQVLPAFELKRPVHSFQLYRGTPLAYRWQCALHANVF